LADRQLLLLFNQLFRVMREQTHLALDCVSLVVVVALAQLVHSSMVGMASLLLLLVQQHFVLVVEVARE